MKKSGRGSCDALLAWTCNACWSCDVTRANPSLLVTILSCLYGLCNGNDVGPLSVQRAKPHLKQAGDESMCLSKPGLTAQSWRVACGTGTPLLVYVHAPGGVHKLLPTGAVVKISPLLPLLHILAQYPCHCSISWLHILARTGLKPLQVEIVLVHLTTWRDQRL